MNFIDLSHPIRERIQVWPGDTDFAVRECATIRRDGYNLTDIRLSVHTGTHVDAFSHFLSGGLTVDQMPLEWFFGTAKLIRLPKGPRELITVEDLEPHARAFADEGRVILSTGWEHRFQEAEYYTDFPSITPQAADWIVSTRVRLLGFDLPSPSQEIVAVHQAFENGGVVVLENLRNLEALPESFTLCAFPMRLAGLEGSPVRAVALTLH